MPQSRPPDSSGQPDHSRLSNVQVCVISLWILGGATTPQDTEDVAAKCFDLAPNRFSWRKYPYPNLESTGVALRDGKKQKNGSLINGNSRIGWLLSAAGVDWARKRNLLLAPTGTVTPRLALRREEAAARSVLGLFQGGSQGARLGVGVRQSSLFAGGRQTRPGAWAVLPRPPPRRRGEKAVPRHCTARHRPARTDRRLPRRPRYPSDGDLPALAPGRAGGDHAPERRLSGPLCPRRVAQQFDGRASRRAAASHQTTGME